MQLVGEEERYSHGCNKYVWIIIMIEKNVILLIVIGRK